MRNPLLGARAPSRRLRIIAAVSISYLSCPSDRAQATGEALDQPVARLEKPTPSVPRSAVDLPAGTEPGWATTVSAAIRDGEYHLSLTTAGDGFTAPNRAHDLRASWRDGTLEVTPRTNPSAWRFSSHLLGVGRLGSTRFTPATPIRREEIAAGRIEWSRDMLREWYRNDVRGINQGYELAVSPAGDRQTPVVLDGRIEGLLAYPTADGQSIVLRTPAGKDALRLSALVVRDARGRDLTACLDVAPGMLRILIDDRSAVYPIHVDPLLTGPVWTAEGDQTEAHFGGSVATAGDVNGDGFSDVIVGALWYDNGEDREGRAFVYHGSASGLQTSPAWTAEGDQSGARFGGSVATAGDVNGDGFSDVIVSAVFFHNGEFDEGRAFLYHGSASGLQTSPAWTAEGDQQNANFGSCVATAGDVNGDGFSDVIVGAWQYTNGEDVEGRAFVYHGSASGLSTSPAWTAESNQIQAGLGGSVATAGDVNGDGFSDVIVGARAYDDGEPDEGRASVYLGSVSGLAATPAWAAESDQPGANFGVSVATAGDVNGDGFSDVIVGAWRYDNGEPDEGRALVYDGSASGLATTPAWTAEGDQAGAEFGSSVATAGNVNGDGFSDVIIGAWHYENGQEGEGRALVYHGSASGLATTPAWTAEGDQQRASLGNSVATAGDVNGDSYSDIIVGAWRYDDGEPDEGRAFVYLGNEGNGPDRIPRQVRADGSAPIDLLCAANASGDFRLRANGRSPFGRDRVRLESEVKPLAVPFDGLGIQTSPWFDTGVPGPSGSVVPLDEFHTALPAIGPYHWRLRLRSRFPFPWQSHWMGMPYNNLTETDLRAGCAGAAAPGDLGNVLRAVARRVTDEVDLTWSSSDPLVVAFHLRRGTVPAAAYPLHPSAGVLPAPAYSDAVLGDAASYYYKVSGLNCAQVEGP